MRQRDLLEGTAWLLLGLFLLSGAWAVRAQARIAGQIIRLHVLAASDSPEDQARKLRVRDAALSRTAPLLRDAGNRAEAERVLREHLPELGDAAADLLACEGCTDGVRLELAETDFPTRVYGGNQGGGSYPNGVSPENGAGQDGFALPAGRYLALRVVIGPGAGENWWCVVFPPLCGGGTETEAAGDEMPETASDVETREAADARTKAGEQSADVRTNAAEDVGAEDVGAEELGDLRTEEQSTVQADTAQEIATPAVPATPATSSAVSIPATPATPTASAAPAAATVRGLPAASRRYEVRFRVAELWGRVRAALS